MKAFGNYHPAALMIYFLSVLLVAMFVSNPVLQILAMLGGILFCIMLQRRSEIGGNIGFYVPMFFLKMCIRDRQMTMRQELSAGYRTDIQ